MLETKLDLPATHHAKARLRDALWVPAFLLMVFACLEQNSTFLLPAVPKLACVLHTDGCIFCC